MPKRAWARGSSRRMRGSSGGGLPAMHWRSSSRAAWSHEVLLNEDPQFLFGGSGYGARIGEDGVGQRGAALAGARFGHLGHRLGDYAAGVFGVLDQIGDDVVDGDGVMFGMPAIVIRHHGDGDVADLGFARQLGLLQVGHADDVHAPSAVSYTHLTLLTNRNV